MHFQGKFQIRISTCGVVLRKIRKQFVYLLVASDKDYVEIYGI